MYEYYACSGCKREFFSEAEFKAHDCMANHKSSTGKLAKLATGEKMATFDTKPGVTSAPVKKPVTEKAENELLTIDKTLDSCKEIVDMKTELVANGVQCQTLNEEQTRAAYAKLKESQAQKANDADGGNVPPPVEPSATTATTTARRGRKKAETDK